MKKTIRLFALAALFALPTFANETAFNLMGRFLDNGNIMILGEDNIEREAVLLSPQEYAALTSAVEFISIYLQDQREYRVKLHGKLQKRGIDIEKKVKYEIYADGYRYEDKMGARDKQKYLPKIAVTDKTDKIEKAKHRKRTRPSTMSLDQWNFEQEKERVKEDGRSINLAHDATTGKDIITE